MSQDYPRFELQVKDVRFKVRAKGQEKEILKGVSVNVRSGQVLAIMGPSGAGKSTLMNLLTLNGGPGKASGSVTLNGDALTETTFTRCCSVVEQEDRHSPFLTCRESLEFAAAVHLSGSSIERTARVDDLLKQMGLESCQHTRVGNQFVPGLSGGQKRRLSVGVALMKRPLLLFLDEPTSGLDAAAAANVMDFLKALAHDTGIAVVCTIHQPSSRVFAGFDQLLLLSGGQVAYCGPAFRAEGYFAGLGMDIPSQTNPADFMLDLVNRDFAEAESVQQVISGWEQLGTTQLAKQATMEFSTRGPPRATRYGRSLGGQVWELLKRQVKLTIRDPTAYTGRMIVNLLACSFFALVYLKSRERVQEQATNKLMLSMWFVGVPACMGVVAVFSMNQEFAAVKREVKDGAYSVMSYGLASTLVQIPIMFVLGVFALAVSAYGIGAWNPKFFFLVLVVYSANLWCFECVAQFLSVMSKNPLLGMLNFMQFWFAAFLFSGMLVAEDFVVWPLRALCKVMPLKYGLRSIAYLEIHDTIWEGAELDSSSNRGFRCPSDPTYRKCFGRTGLQVLDSLHQMFDSISTENTMLDDVVHLVLVALLFKVLFLVAAMVKCRGSKPLTQLKQ